MSGYLLKEVNIKEQVRDLLKAYGIFNYPITQGIATYPGLPDRVLHYRGVAIYLEIKRPGGKLSEAQKRFQVQCLADGINYWVIDDVEELAKLLEGTSE